MKYLSNKNGFLGVDNKFNFKEKVIMVPFGLEKTVSYGGGTRNVPKEIIKASHQVELYDEELNCEPYKKIGIRTLKPFKIDRNIKKALETMSNINKEILDKKLFPITFGGEHSITPGCIDPFIKKYKKICILHFDAHADLRANYENQAHSHASVMYLLSKSKYKIAQFGVRALSKEEVKNRNILEILYFDVEDIKNKKDIILPNNFPQNIYITFDVDGLDPSIMPATGTPVPGGLGFNESLKLIKSLIRGRKVIGFDVVEFSPIKNFFAYDFTVASLVYRIMELIDLND